MFKEFGEKIFGEGENFLDKESDKEPKPKSAVEKVGTFKVGQEIEWDGKRRYIIGFDAKDGELKALVSTTSDPEKEAGAANWVSLEELKKIEEEK